MAETRYDSAPKKGNAAAIDSLPGELRETVKGLHASLWKVWEGMVSPAKWGCLVIPLCLLSAGPAHWHLPWLSQPVVLFGLLCTYLASVWFFSLFYSHQVDEGYRHFAKFVDNSPNAEEALKALRQIEPWRTWLFFL